MTTYSTIKKKFFNRFFSAGKVYCAYCAQELTVETATIDHVVPRHDGGKSRASNYLIACAPCNHQRGKDTYKARQFGIRTHACFLCGEHHSKSPCYNFKL